jgi:sortase (surface protein transpeptidase)
MRRTYSRLTGDHRGLATTVVTCLLVLAGVTCIGIAFTHQQASSQRPMPAAGSPAPSAVSGDPQQAATETPAPVVGPVLDASAPVALAIPAIDVRTPLLRLGRTADGAMEVPAPGPHYDEAGWYRHSPTPGSLGPAVIAGHVDSATTGPSVFFRLSSLRPRDKVRVTRADGTVAVFAVDDVRRFRKSRFPTRLVYGNTDHAALRLITCGGPISSVSGHYRDNVVVLASLIRPAI